MKRVLCVIDIYFLCAFLEYDYGFQIVCLVLPHLAKYKWKNMDVLKFSICIAIKLII